MGTTLRSRDQFVEAVQRLQPGGKYADSSGTDILSFFTSYAKPDGRIHLASLPDVEGSSTSFRGALASAVIFDADQRRHQP